MATTPDRCAAIPRDLNSLEPIGTSRGSGKGSFKSCIWGERTLCPSTGWGTSGSSSTKKDQGILVDKKLTVSQHCTRETISKEKPCQQAEGDDTSTVDTHQCQPVPSPVLCLPVQEMDKLQQRAMKMIVGQEHLKGG